MIYRKVIRKGPMPLFGRQLFRGQLAPLILANNMGVSPDQYAAAYDVATPIDHDTAPVVIPPAPANVEPCPFSYDEEMVCNNIDPDFSFCKKRSLAKTDPACIQAGNMECDYTETLKKVCTSDPRDPKYAVFCDFKKHNGMCIDDFITEQQGEENVKKQEEKQAEQVWKATRGCKFANFPLQVGMTNSFVKTPCPFGTSDDNKPGQIKSLNGKQYKFIGWVPDKP